MKELENRILEDGIVLPGDILKVGSFLNQQVDTLLLDHMANEAVSLFKGEKISKVITIESSGIPLATAIAMKLMCPIVIVKKNAASNLSSHVYAAPIHSYTHGNDYTAMVDKNYITSQDSILIVDDFLASGEALNGLISIVREAGATLVGCCTAIEKKFQKGGDNLRAQGIHVESLAIVDSMSDHNLTFYKPQEA